MDLIIKNSFTDAILSAKATGCVEIINEIFSIHTTDDPMHPLELHNTETQEVKKYSLPSIHHAVLDNDTWVLYNEATDQNDLLVVHFDL